jgi:hypothetical protein
MLVAASAGGGGATPDGKPNVGELLMEDTEGFEYKWVGNKLWRRPVTEGGDDDGGPLATAVAAGGGSSAKMNSTAAGLAPMTT